MFCLRAATGSIVLVDHIDDLGAFHKKSEINIRTLITQLKTFTEVKTDGLLNALRCGPYPLACSALLCPALVLTRTIFFADSPRST